MYIKTKDTSKYNKCKFITIPYATCIYDTKLITSLYGCFPIENTKLIT